jgi:bifunctional non-homologous end joining protein LigD
MDALLVGYYSGGRLMFAGKVRAGFVPHVRRQLTAKLKALHTERCLFMNLPDAKSSRWGGGVTAEEMREFQWVRPELIVQIRFVEWTAEGRLRHAVFVGERPDKKAKEVRRELPR